MIGVRPQDSIPIDRFADANGDEIGDFAGLLKEDWYFVDFDAGPVQRLEARRANEPPLKDVASMLRSFDYAARHVAAERATLLPTSAATAEFHALAWRDAARTVFLAAYNTSAAGDVGGTPGWPKEEQLRVRLIDLYALEKALYEVVYEAANRPAWLRIPVRGILEILGLIKAALNAESV